jgi:lipopolysaccharide heptosyltransferase II
MSMPAVQGFRRLHPQVPLHVLVKPAIAPLWELLPDAPDGVLLLQPGIRGIQQATKHLRLIPFRRAYVLPKSFRSALAPWLAGIPERIGMPGHARDLMLTRVVSPTLRHGHEHQVYEYLELLTPEEPDRTPEPPRLRVPDRDREVADTLLPGDSGQDWVGLLPGAARGPSKQWPAAHFAALGRELATAGGLRLAVMGAPAERTLCQAVTAATGPAAVNLAGHTTFLQWAAALARCRVVVTNDSGGMHLAAALGTPVIALFGRTDPARTGPLGPARILQNSSIRSRDIPRHSRSARFALASIPPDTVYQAVLQALRETP